jgi:hypothetical protein
MNYKEITTWESACKVHGIDPTALPEVSKLPAKFQQWLIDAYKLGVITEAINTDENGKIWIPDYNNDNQRKYFPWFEVEASKDKPSGFGFSITGCVDWSTNPGCGSRLCFDTREKVYHIQEHFEELFISFHLIKD